jgi:hypothetical protein
MEPTLQHGDIVLVRKSDFYGWHSIPKTAAQPPQPPAPQPTRTRTNNLNHSSTIPSSTTTTTTTTADTSSPPSSPEHDARNEADFLKLQHHQNQERIQLQQLEAQHCHNPNTSNTFWLIQKPPLAVTGQVVVYRNLHEFPSSWNIKRVIGVGGQVVRQTNVVYVVCSRIHWNNNNSNHGKKKKGRECNCRVANQQQHRVKREAMICLVFWGACFI